MFLSTTESNPTVLIIDDDPTILFIAGECLEQNGFQHINAQSGTEGLQHLNKNDQLDIIVLDVNLPDMNGIELCKKIRTKDRFKHTPILIITGLDDLEAIPNAYHSGATDFLSKPLNWFHFTERVKFMWKASVLLKKTLQNTQYIEQAQRIAKLGYWEFDTKQELFHCSSEMMKIFRIKSDSHTIAPDTFLSRIPDSERKKFNPSIEQALDFQNITSFDHKIIMDTGECRFVSQQISLLHTPHKKYPLLLGTVQDITTRKRKELITVQRNKALELILNNAPISDIIENFLSHLEKISFSCSYVLLFRHEDNLSVMGHSDFKTETNLSDQALLNLCSYIEEKIFCAEPSLIEIPEISQNIFSNHNFHEKSIAIPISFDLKSTIQSIIILFPVRSPRIEFIDEELKIFSQLVSIALRQRKMSDSLTYQAFHDQLTRLPNRSFYFKKLEKTIALAQKEKLSFAVLFIDLDGFKGVNDLLGHDTGDSLLQACANRMRQSIRSSDTIARIGGDEFSIIAFPIQKQTDPESIGNKILNCLTQPFKIKSHTINISASIGISTYPKDGMTGTELQKHSDLAMYNAKKTGGSTINFFSSEVNAKYLKEISINNELKKSISKNELYLNYQPIYTCNNKTIRKAEALLRWKSAKIGNISPEHFIPIAEEKGMINEIGEWVIRQGCRQCSQWKEKGIETTLSINVSTLQFLKKGFISSLINIMNSFYVKPHNIEIEITESCVINEIPLAVSKLRKLYEAGISVSLDDFGTGFSSMAYLRDLPLSGIKIDQKFIRDLNENNCSKSRSLALLHSLISLGNTLGLNITAEGIESEYQYRLTSGAGCDFAQGFFMSRPVSAGDFEKLYLQSQTRQLPIIQPNGTSKTPHPGNHPGEEPLSKIITPSLHG